MAVHSSAKLLFVFCCVGKALSRMQLDVAMCMATMFIRCFV